MTTSNKIALLAVLVTAIGIIVSYFNSNNSPEAKVTQSSTGGNSPVINTSGNVNIETE